MRADPQTRFWANVVRDAETGCFIWLGQNNGRYGQIHLDGKTQLAHRIAYEWAIGPVPDGNVLDHLCRLTLCVNPGHLEAVTQRENLLRSPLTLNTVNSAKTHCPQGHAYSLAHLTWRGSRRCLPCHAAEERRRRRRQAVSA